MAWFRIALIALALAAGFAGTAAVVGNAALAKSDEAPKPP
jgi:hypothetical protein